LVGAIYLAAEDRQIVVSTADGPQVVTLRDPKLRDAQSGDQAVHAAPEQVGPSAAKRDGSGRRAVDRTVTKNPGPSAATEEPAQANEVAAEQQAAQIPAQTPPKKTANEAHTRQIVISIPDRQLALLEDGQLVKAYPVAVGKDETPSPAGEFTVINHAVNPTYRHDGKEIGPGKDNPLGTRWMGLSVKGYGIHGTNVQSSVGKVASHGCFRMKKKDVEELYKLVQVGDAVSIRGERDQLTASLFKGDAVVAAAGAEVASASPVTTTAGVDQ
jgi:lipoprotein-anchoring transpeptidase ErfK/SrfK